MASLMTFLSFLCLQANIPPLVWVFSFMDNNSLHFHCSLLPYTLHPVVAKSCIAFKKNLLTTSYVLPAIEELHQRYWLENKICYITVPSLHESTNWILVIHNCSSKRAIISLDNVFTLLCWLDLIFLATSSQQLYIQPLWHTKALISQIGNTSQVSGLDPLPPYPIALQKTGKCCEIWQLGTSIS